MSIDLNADLGEGDAFDKSLLEVVSSCNIACGGHAGDDDSMRVTMREALRQNVAIGAHPSYPDREQFGRRSVFMRDDDLFASLAGQLANIASIAEELGTSINHVKPHGALYNDATEDTELADTVARATATIPGRPALVGPPGSSLAVAAASHGLQFIAEAFVDRAYLPNGRLMPRSETGAVYSDPATIASQAVALAANGRVQSASGEIVDIDAQTLCLHGDTPGAPDAARAVRAALEAAGVTIRAVNR